LQLTAENNRPWRFADHIVADVGTGQAQRSRR
jgi:hypothetical protein